MAISQTDQVDDWLAATVACDADRAWHRLECQLQPHRHLTDAAVWSKLPQPPLRFELPAPLFQTDLV